MIKLLFCISIKICNHSTVLAIMQDKSFIISGTVFQSSIFLVGVLGNLMVVLTVRGTKSLHTTTNCYLVSLALSDMITLLSSVPQVSEVDNKIFLNGILLNNNLIAFRSILKKIFQDYVHHFP